MEFIQGMDWNKTNSFQKKTHTQILVVDFMWYTDNNNNKSSDIITNFLLVDLNPEGCTFLTCILSSTHNAEGIKYKEHRPNQMDGKRLPKGAKGQKRQGGSKSPLKPKWVVLSLWGNRAVAKHSERERPVKARSSASQLTNVAHTSTE